MPQKATIGRILHYTALGDEAPGLSKGEIRPAIVVRVWPNEYPAPGAKTEAGDLLLGDGYNVQVLLDGRADSPSNDGAAVLWLTSLALCEKPTPGHLHWPERA